MKCSYLYKYYDKLFTDCDFFFGFMVGNIIEYVYILYSMLLFFCFSFFFFFIFFFLTTIIIS